MSKRKAKRSDEAEEYPESEGWFLSVTGKWIRLDGSAVTEATASHYQGA